MAETGVAPSGVSNVPFKTRSLLIKDGRACVVVRDNSSDVASDCAEIENKLHVKSNYKRGYVPTYIKVSCGSCMECIEQKVNQLMSRMSIEMKNFGNYAYFLTLTYNDDNIPLNEVVDDDGCLTGSFVMSVRKSDIQCFLKRLRVNLERSGYNNELKYFYISEYGFTATEHMRPHYHIMLFIRDIALNELYDVCVKSWSCGFVTLDPLLEERMLYCARSHATASKLFPNPPGSDKPFSHWSKGFGLPSGDELSFVRSNNSVKIGDFSYPIDRYLKEKCFSKDELFLKKIVRAYNGPVDDDYYKKFVQYMQRMYPRINEPSLLSSFQVKRICKAIDDDKEVNGNLFYRRYVLKKKNI